MLVMTVDDREVRTSTTLANITWYVKLATSSLQNADVRITDHRATERYPKPWPWLQINAKKPLHQSAESLICVASLS